MWNGSTLRASCRSAAVAVNPTQPLPRRCFWRFPLNFFHAWKKCQHCNLPRRTVVHSDNPPRVNLPPILTDMAQRGSRGPEQKHLRSAAGLVAGAVVGIVATFLSGFALVPRVRLVDVCILVASAVGSGATLTAAIFQFRQAKAAAREKQVSRR
jgi:hypothetical protein